MNLKKKTRSKLKIFGSFSGKSRKYKDEECAKTSTPVLLGVKKRPEEETNCPVMILHSLNKSLSRQR